MLDIADWQCYTVKAALNGSEARDLAVIDEENTVFGAPVIEGASVSANVVKNGKSKKVRVYKMKPKKGYRRTQGHRQPYTKVQIETINA